MKKTRRVLSILLSALIVFASMPVVYTQVTAAGTIDNPTTPVQESNPFEHEDLFKLNIKHSNNNFFFYQTIDDEYFVVEQDLFLQQYTVSLGSNRTLTFHGIDFYTGGSNLAEHSDYAGVVEEPAITTNETSDFLSKFYVSDSWTSTHTNTTNIDCTGEFNLAASGWDLNGRHMEYTWDHAIIFKGHSAETAGQIDTGYYERATWDWYGDNDTHASMDFRIRTTITVVDARAFVNAIAKAEDALANPDEHSEGYISAIEAIFNSIPEDAKNLTGMYSQAVLDGFANDINNVKEDAANYSEYNYLYSFFSSMTNADGTYSAQSFTEFKQTIAQIDANLSKDLSATDQKVVDDAVAALRNAYETILVNNASLTPGITHSETIQEMTVTVGTEFNLIQVRDNQKFSLAQPWTMSHNNSQARKFAVVLDTSDANTNAFIARLDASSYGTQNFDNKALSQNGVTTFSCWYELDANGNLMDSSDFLNTSTHTINADYSGFKKGNTYYLQSTPIFYGLSENESGATQYLYNQIFYVGWLNALGFGGGSGSSTFTTTVNITDARTLVDLYEEAGIILSMEESGYSDQYLEALREIYDTVPRDMVNGTKYYTQAQVDAYVNEFNALTDTLADYSAIDAAYARLESILANSDAYAGTTITTVQNAMAQADAFDKGLINTAANRQTIADMAAYLNSVADSAEARADYSTYNQYLDICLNKNPDFNLNPSQFTGDAYKEFMDVVEYVQATTPLDLGTSQQGVVDEACNALLNAFIKLTGGSITDPDSVGDPFTQDAITGEYTNGVIKFSIGYDEYNFTQTVHDEKLSIKTYLTISSADSTKTVVLKALNISSLDSSELANLDTSGNCYNSDSVTINNAENLFIKNNLQYNVVQGVDLLLDANGEQYADINGDMAWFNTWQNTSGVALSTNGLINDATTLTTQDSSAQAELIFASAGGGDLETKTRSYTYVLRLAWTEDGVEHHAHIPVTFNISDARDLHATYYSYMEFINAGNDGTYTDASFQAATDIMASVNRDIVDGNGYFTQEEINAEREKLNNALLSLQVKASYDAFNEAKANAEAILNAPAGTYTDASITALQNALADVADLSMDLDVSQQGVIDEATQKLLVALESIQEKADYSDFNDAKDALEDIVNNPDDYTSDTVDKAQDALDDANAIDPDLPKDENGVNQGIIDEATQNMQDVLDSAEKKADYSDYNDAKSEADSLTNDGNVYNQDAFDAYKEAVDAIDSALNKDLSVENQAIVDKATQDLLDAKAELENNKYADYTEFDRLKEILDYIVNAEDGTFTDETINSVQDVLDYVNTIPGDLVVGENNVNQDVIDEASQMMKDVIAEVERKADYSEFDDAYSQLEDIVSNPDKYTSETVEAAQNALNNADLLDKDLSSDDQAIVDEATEALKNVLAGVVERADYSDYNDAKSEADSLTNDGNVYNQDAFDAYKEAVDAIDSALDKNLSSDDQAIVDEATAALESLRAELENNKYADYTDFDAAKDALEEIVNAPAGTYTDETVKNAQDALDNANTIPEDMVVGENNVNQDMIDEATQNMQDVLDSAEKKADYSELDDVKDALQDIVNNADDYTSETVERAQEALDRIEELDKDLGESEQGIIDELVSELQDVVDSAEKKADYSDFEDAYSRVENIINNADRYTSETVEAAQNALNNADLLDKDLSSDDQAIVDAATEALENMLAGAKEKADYTWYDDVKSEADSLVNDDGNGNPIYDEEAFEAYKEAVEAIDNALSKDLSSDEQAIVDEAAEALNELKNTLDEKKYYTVTYLDADGNVIGTERFVAGTLFSQLNAPALPEDTDAHAYLGWLYFGSLAAADDVFSEDAVIQIVREDKTLNIIDETLSIHSATGYITSETRDMTVSQLLAMFANDAELIVVQDLEGNVLSGDALVGTGATVTLTSRYSDVIYDSRTLVVYGDVTGDGLVNADDYAAAKLANIIPGTYNADNYYFFVANDVMADGYIDALDSAYIHLMVKGIR